MTRRSIRPLCLLLFPVLLPAREPASPGCGTHLERATEELYLHRQAQRKRSGARSTRSVAANHDYGNIAVIDDADGVVSQRHDFNLSQRTVAFIPSAAGAARYRIQTAGASYDASAADAGAKLDALGDDDSRRVPLPFTFPFYGAEYREVWVNSDGNLTFTSGDPNSTERSLGRMVGGAPRIAPLFTDLDPSTARGDAGVRILSEPGRLVISWKSVPVFSDFGGGSPQTFQVRLFPDGRIEFAYSNIIVSDAVTGIGPGRVTGNLAVVSLADGPQDEYSGPVADQFSSLPAVDVAAAAQKFYATHDDAYDYLVMYNAVGVSASASAVAYEVTVRNNRSGYGDRPVDTGAEYGSKRRLQAVLNLGPLNQYPDDPNGIVGARGPTGDTSLSVLGHETGHLFLAFASVRDPNDPTAKPMLGRALVHWSFDFNSEASLLEGTRLVDHGENTSPRFLTSATVEGYSPLDQYLMGFRPPAEVPPTFLVTGSLYPANHFPQVGIQFDGQRRNISVDDVIAAEGRRTPDDTVAQRRFRFAFILITHAGQPPLAEQIGKVDAVRAAFESYYSNTTSNRASADTGLHRAVQLSASPASGVLAGRDGAATLSLDARAQSPVTFTLATTTGAASVPASVTVPAGASTVAFAIHGVREGVEELTVTPADTSYETVTSRVQVRSAISSLSLELLTPDRVSSAALSPVQVRVTDVNKLPFAGVPVTAVPSNGATTPASVVTDDQGIATFRWTPSATSGTLKIALDASNTATVTLVAPPAVFPNGAVNAAAYAPGITPGSLATIFGTGLAGSAVWVDGTAAAVTYASDNQINFVVPITATASIANIEILSPSGGRTVYAAPVNAVSPGIFGVLIANTGLTTSVRPAHIGDILEIYSTGLGVAPAPVEVLIGDVAATVLSTTALSQYPGLYQVNVRVAAGTPAGDQPITLKSGGVVSNQPRVTVVN